jgi:hypothetical protein
MPSKTIAIMQPYFLPYIGYWQLMHVVDEFVVYDEIQYTKKGWINRNRFLQNGKDALFTLPLKADSDYKNVNERYLSADFDREKLIRQFTESYRKAPYFKSHFSLIEDIIREPEQNLFLYILNSIHKIKEFLKIPTPLIISSQLQLSDARSADKVIEICKKRDAKNYINPIGGVGLYNSDYFLTRDINLKFLRAVPVPYQQFAHDFVPHLSILDVVMFHDRDGARALLDTYEWVSS